MPIYSVGKILKICREEKKITQEELCEGICTTSALSKIENGHREPTYVTFASLMERMGEWPEAYDCFMGDQSYRIQKCQDAILQLQYEKKYEEAAKMLEKLDELMKEHPKNAVYEQFLRLNRLLVATKGYVDQTQLQEMENILRMTVPSFGKKPVSALFLTHQELMGINAIAIGCGENGDCERAISLLRDLKEYLEQDFIGVRMKQSAYSTICCNLVKYLGLGGAHQAAIREANALVDDLRKLGKTLLISDLHYAVAWNYMKMDREKYAREMETAIALSLYADISCRNFENAEETIALVKKNMEELLDRPNVRQCLDLYHYLVQLYSQTPTE